MYRGNMELISQLPKGSPFVVHRADGSTEFARKVHQINLLTVTEVASGLAYLHSHSIRMWAVHPRNIMLDKDMHVKLTDYGRDGRVMRRLVNAALARPGSDELAQIEATTVASPTQFRSDSDCRLH